MKDSNIAVSVIIPVYNAEKYLKQCIDSISAQTLREIEIICVNDGSSDDSLEILNKCAVEDTRIRVIDQGNQGAANARNVGMEYARGKYLSILDSDDLFYPDMLLNAYLRIEEAQADIVVFRSNTYDNDLKEYKESLWTLKKEYIPSDLFSSKDVANHIFQFCIGWTWDKLFKRDFIMSLGLRFQDIRIHNDALFVFASLVEADRIAILENILVTKRTSITTAISAPKSINSFWRDLFLFIDAMDEYLQTRELRDFERSFLNISLRLAMYLYERVDEATKKEMRKYLNATFFPKYRFSDRGELYFDYKFEYKVMQEIMTLEETQILTLRKVIRYRQQYGTVATLKKAVTKLRF